MKYYTFKVHEAGETEPLCEVYVLSSDGSPAAKDEQDAVAKAIAYVRRIAGPGDYTAVLVEES